MKAILRSGFLALAIMLAAAVPANAGPYEDGVKAAERGDYTTALNFWRPLAEQGHGVAQSHLGFMYENGKGVPQNDAEAVKWYRKAAEQGHPAAQQNLGTMYGYGYGVPQDNADAHMWFNLAASRLPPGEDRDKAVKLRDLFASKMTPAQIAEAQKLARGWMAAFEKRKKK